MLFFSSTGCTGRICFLNFNLVSITDHRPSFTFSENKQTKTFKLGKIKIDGRGKILFYSYFSEV